jgi:hypothetical protein
MVVEILQHQIDIAVAPLHALLPGENVDKREKREEKKIRKVLHLDKPRFLHIFAQNFDNLESVGVLHHRLI